MEHIQNPLSDENEQRVRQFSGFLESVITVEDLFDDGAAGDREPREPLPPTPSTSASKYHEDYFAPVYLLHPPMPVQAVGKNALRLVYS